MLWVITVLYVLLAGSIALWHGCVKQMFSQRDLNRLGYFAGNEDIISPKEYSMYRTEMKDYLEGSMRESFDVITIGDSFTNGRRGSWYQDYLAERYNIKSLNYFGKNLCLEDLYMLISSGLIDEIHPKAVILEKVERGVQNELGKTKINLIPSDKKDIYILASKKNTNAAQISNGIFPPVMIKASMNFLTSNLMRIINSERLSNEAYTAELDRNLFTNVKNEHKLLFYYYDLNYLENPADAKMINKNLNAAAEILSEKGIKLIFMPCVDKYDLYYPYIKDKKGRPENNFFPAMRNVPDKKYIFIDTKAILRKALGRGETDLYWFGDTHWSWKGFELVCDEIVKYLQP